MKKLLLLIALTTAVAGAMAQGSVNFANSVSSATPKLSAPVYEDTVGGTVKLSDNYVAALYWGTSADALQPALQGGALVTKAFIKSSSTGLGTGIFSTGSTLAIDGTKSGDQVWVQVRAWASANGATWDAAKAKWDAGTGKIGTSTAFQVTLGGGTLPPSTLANLTSFAVVPVPEPTVLALGVLGGVAFLMRRRS